jgi:hypothetical protein
MIEEYKKYLIEKSGEVKNHSDIYSHSGIINMLSEPSSYGYEASDTNLLVEKARIIIITWGKNKDIDTYDQFIARHRDNKLTEIGI